jgi:hypothetical protein
MHHIILSISSKRKPVATAAHPRRPGSSGRRFPTLL